MSFSPPSIPPDALPASYIVPSTTEVSNGVSARLNVGQDLRDPTREAQDELDDSIRDLQTLAALAQDRGDIETAFEYTRRMLAASHGRTREHKDRLAREHLAMVERSLDEGVAYFAVEGDKAAAEMERRAA